MKVRLHKRFLKDLSRIPEKQRKKIEHFIFEEALEFKNIKHIPGFEKLKGYKTYYKIRFGSYKAGIKYEGDILYFERILHRKDIYKYYP